MNVGISGKRFVIPFAAVLVFLLGLMLSIAINFQRQMVQLDEVRSLWPLASQELSQRYGMINRNLTDEASLDDVARRLWSEEYKSFLESSRYDRQSSHALKLEEILSSGNIKLQDSVIGTELLQSNVPVQRLLEADSKRRKLQESIIGRMTIASLRLKLPPVFSLSDSN